MLYKRSKAASWPRTRLRSGKNSKREESFDYGEEFAEESLRAFTCDGWVPIMPEKAVAEESKGGSEELLETPRS